MAAPHLASPIWHVVTALAVAGALALHGGPVHAAPDPASSGTLRFGDGGEAYRGYRIVIARDVANAEIGTLRRAAEHQIDLVEATPLDGRTKAFLRGVPIIVGSGSGEGSHYSGGDSVSIALEGPNDDRPILLHEFMHVYQARRLPGGTDNPDIRTFYERARNGGFYPAGAYVLKNRGEFFAMTASVFLHGSLAREPFTRAELRQKQPVYYRYLTRLFGAPQVAADPAPRPAGAQSLQPCGVTQP